MKVSVAMATYNGAAHLEEQLNSLLIQTRKPDELVISDDASQDGTCRIIDEFCSSAPFNVSFLRSAENSGYAMNFNRALSYTSGDLVFLSDQDDVWFPEKIERMEAMANEQPDASVVMCDAVLTDSKLRESGLTKIGQLRSLGRPTTTFVMGCCAAVRREFLELVMPIPRDYPAHDGWLLGIADGIGSKRIINEPLQYYRRHSRNTSRVVANSVRPITRLDYYLRRVQNLIKADGQTAIRDIERLRMLREGALRAAGRAGDGQGEALRCFACRLDVRIEAARTRTRIRSAPRIARLPEVVQLWRSGSYSAANGLMSALRDLLLR